MKHAALLMVCLLAFGGAMAQRMPERHLVRKGNRQFSREKYEKSIESYTRAAEAAPTSFEAAFNLANAQFRTERYDGAEKGLARLAADTTLVDADRADAAYNLGNAQFAQQKLKEALASYRLAMRLNPDDQEAKYNYAYTKHLLQQQEQQEQQNQDNQDNKDNENNDNSKDNQDNKDKNFDNQNDSDKQDNGQDKENADRQDGNDEQNGQPQQQDKQEQSGEQQPSASGIPEQEREAMLEAIQAQEDKTQDKLKEKQGIVIRGKKNW